MASTRGWMALVLVATACVTDPPALPQLPTEGGESTASETGSVVDSTGPAATNPDPSTTGTGPTSGSGPGATTSSADGTAADTAMLVIEGAPEYDFGIVPTGEFEVAILEVTNLGDGEATGIMARALAAPFAFTSSGFPGTTGDCSDTLAAGDSCGVEVMFAPADLGVQQATLTIAYNDAPDATRSLVGGGQGASDNLLVNPGGENEGTPPPSWDVIGPGEWIAGSAAVSPVTGAFVLFSGAGPSNQTFTLRQEIDVSVWVDTIDLGAMAFSFEGWGRAFARGDNDYRIRVRYRDGAGAVLETFTTDWNSSSNWVLYADLRAAPPGTRSIRVDLDCQKAFGTTCDAYFDALELRAQYP